MVLVVPSDAVTSLAEKAGSGQETVAVREVVCRVLVKVTVPSHCLPEAISLMTVNVAFPLAEAVVV